MAAPLEVEIIIHTPTLFYHCQHCEVVWHETGFSRGVRAEQLRSGLPEDMQREHAAIADWVHRLLATYGDRIAVNVIDAASVRGLWKSLRYGIHRYPVIVVERREKFVGTDLGSVDAVIARRLSAAPLAGGQDVSRASASREKESRR